MARVIENLENAFEEMFDFITDLPSGLDGFESDFDAAFEELKELKATLTPPNEWVSVDNKLPKNGVPVLIGNPHWDYPVVANYAGHGVWMDSWKQKMTFTPTHWMLLPAPPDRRPPEGET